MEQQGWPLWVTFAALMHSLPAPHSPAGLSLALFTWFGYRIWAGWLHLATWFLGNYLSTSMSWAIGFSW